MQESAHKSPNFLVKFSSFTSTHRVSTDEFRDAQVDLRHFYKLTLSFHAVAPRTVETIYRWLKTPPLSNEGCRGWNVWYNFLCLVVLCPPHGKKLTVPVLSVSQVRSVDARCDSAGPLAAELLPLTAPVRLSTLEILAWSFFLWTERTLVTLLSCRSLVWFPGRTIVTCHDFSPPWTSIKQWFIYSAFIYMSHIVGQSDFMEDKRGHYKSLYR